MIRCYKLNVPKFLFVDNFKFPEFRNNFNHQSWTLKANQVIHSETLNYFQTEFGLQLTDCLISYLKAGKAGNDIHVDGYGHNVVQWAINYVSTGHDTKMCWYVPTAKSTPYKADFGKIIEVWNENEVDLVEEYNIGKYPILVKIDEPHRIYNNGAADRWSVSLRNYVSEISWDNVVHRLAGVRITDNI